jgi:urea transport system substrate-binding protein
MVGEYLASGYFQSVDSLANHRFVERLKAKYGERRLTTDSMATAYGGVHLWAQAVRAAQSASPADVRAVLGEQSLLGPVGPVQLDPKSFYAYRFFRLGQVEDKGTIQIVHSSPVPLAPEVYPPTRTPKQWQAFLDTLRQNWGGKWSASPNN